MWLVRFVGPWFFHGQNDFFLDWTRAIFHEKFFQKTVHDTWNIYDLICSIQMELSPFGTLLKFSWKLCLEFLENSWMDIWLSLHGGKAFLFLYFIFIVHEMWKIKIFRGQFFRKIFNLIFQGIVHVAIVRGQSTSMDNCPRNVQDPKNWYLWNFIDEKIWNRWNISVELFMYRLKTNFCPSFPERKDEWKVSRFFLKRCVRSV